MQRFARYRGLSILFNGNTNAEEINFPPVTTVFLARKLERVARSTKIIAKLRKSLGPVGFLENRRVCARLRWSDLRRFRPSMLSGLLDSDAKRAVDVELCWRTTEVRSSKAF